MVSTFQLTALAERFAETLPTVLAGGTAVAVFAWALLRFGKGQHSGTRFMVWFSALAAVSSLFVVGMHSPLRATAVQSSSGPGAPIELPASWALYVFAGCAACFSVAVLRVFAGLWQVYKLRKTCVPVDLATVPAEVRAELQDFQAVRRVTLCRSDRVAVPAALGFFRPLVVFPSWLLQDLSPGEMRQIVLHELAHLRRWDDWTNLLQKLLGALLFFHPAVWWIGTQISAERENACDDLVLSSTKDPGAYAKCLASLAEKSFARRSMALAQAAISRLRQTSSRVARILGGMPGESCVRKPVVALVGLFSLTCVFVQGYVPKLVDFETVHPAQQLAFAAPRIAGPASVLPAMESAAATGTVAKAKARVPRREASRRPAAPATNQPSLVEEAGLGIPAYPAYYDESHAHETHAVEARAHLTQEPAVAGSSVLLVVERQVIEGPENEPPVAIWQFTVWHVTVSPSGHSVQTAITHRSI